MCIQIQLVEKKFVVASQNEPPPSVLGDLRVLFVITKVAGFFPIFRQKSEDEVEPPSKQNRLYSFIVRTVIHVLTALNFFAMFDEENIQSFNTKRETDNANQYMEILISVTTYTGSLILCAKHSQKYLKLVMDILKLDVSIRQRYGARVRNHCESTEKVIIAIVACQLFILAINVSVNSMSPTQYLIIGFQALQNFLCSVFVVLLSSLLRVISMRFQFVNMILDTHAYDMKGIRLHLNRGVRFEDDASFTFELHNRLLKMYKLVNEAGSLTVALFMGYAFYMITTNSYNIFVEFTKNQPASISLLLYCVTWLAINALLLIILTRSCDRLTDKANTTSQILARVYGKSKDYQNIIDKFLTKSIRQEVQFTAYGFFVVDNSTLFKIFSAVTTYLVILIQFKQLEDTKLDESSV